MEEYDYSLKACVESARFQLEHCYHGDLGALLNHYLDCYKEQGVCWNKTMFDAVAVLAKERKA